MIVRGASFWLSFLQLRDHRRIHSLLRLLIGRSLFLAGFLAEANDVVLHWRWSRALARDLHTYVGHILLPPPSSVSALMDGWMNGWGVAGFPVPGPSLPLSDDAVAAILFLSGNSFNTGFLRYIPFGSTSYTLLLYDYSGLDGCHSEQPTQHTPCITFYETCNLSIQSEAPKAAYGGHFITFTCHHGIGVHTYTRWCGIVQRFRYMQHNEWIMKQCKELHDPTLSLSLQYLSLNCAVLSEMM